MSQIVKLYYSALFLLPDRLNSVMNTQEFVLIPKSFYTQQKHSTLQVLRDPEVEQKAKSLTLLQRNNTFPDPSTVEKKEKTSKENILKSLDMLTAAQKQRTREILNKIESSETIDFDETGDITVNKISTKISISTFLYNLQQPNKNLTDPSYSIILKELMVNPNLVPNRNAKNILNPSTTRKRAEPTRDKSDASNEESEEIAKSKASGSKIWTSLGI